MTITTNSENFIEKENKEREACILKENVSYVKDLIEKKFYEPILYKLRNAICFTKKIQKKFLL